MGGHTDKGGASLSEGEWCHKGKESSSEEHL